MQAANEVKKPVIIHTRAAKDDTLNILKSEKVGELWWNTSLFYRRLRYG